MHLRVFVLALFWGGVQAALAQSVRMPTWESHVGNGFEISMPTVWQESETKGFGKAFGYGIGSRSIDGRAMVQGCAVIVLDVTSAKGKSNSVIDAEVDAMVKGISPDELGKMFGIEGIKEVSSVALAGRRALRAITSRTEEMTHLKMKMVQTYIIQV